MDEKTLRPGELRDAPTIRPKHNGAFAAALEHKNDSFDGWAVIETLHSDQHRSIFLAQNAQNELGVIKLYANMLEFPALNKLARINDCRLLTRHEKGLADGCLYEVYPYIRAGTLDGQTLNEETITNVVVPQLMHALFVLHQNQLLHNDVKPSNIFWIQKDLEISLGDFDTVTSITIAPGQETGGTKEYMAPEVLTGGSSALSTASDFCSAGLTILSLLQGGSPFHGKTDVQIRRMWMRGIPIPEHISPKLKVLINGLVQYDPTQRLDVKGIQHWMDMYCTAPREADVPTPSVTPSVHNELKPLWFGELPVLGISDMVECAGTDWEHGRFLLEQKRFSNFLRQFSVDYYQLCCKCEQRFDKNEGLFLLLHSLTCSDSFYWYGEYYDNLEDFIVRMIDSEDPDTFAKGAHFLRSNMLGAYLTNLGASSEKTGLAEELSTVAYQHPELAMMQLLESLSEIPELKWHNQVFHTLDEFAQWLLTTEGNLDELIRDVYTSMRFEAWLTFIEQGTFLYEVQNTMKGMAP